MDGIDDPDGHLCLLARQGNAVAYAQLRQRHQGRVRAELRKRCHGISEADVADLDQQVWIAVWSALPRYQGHSTFATWLVGVTKNILYAWLRRERSDELTLQRFLELNGPAGAGAAESDPLDQLAAVEAISRLPASEHQVIELRYFQQCADQEIAARLHMPLGTVKGRLRSGLLHLREGFHSDSMKPFGRAGDARVTKSVPQHGRSAGASRHDASTNM